MLLLLFETWRFLVLFRELSPIGEDDAVEEMIERLKRKASANDNGMKKERDFLVD